jgi:glycosyltransferase involved in cell wall biosynthesis
MNMKLLCLGHKEIMPPDDGGREGVHGALAALARRAEVTYAYPAGVERPLSLAGYAAIDVHCVPVAFAPRESAAVVAGSTLRLMPYKFAKHATSKATAAFAAALRALRFDAVVCFHAHTARLAERLLQRRGEAVPVVLREHNIEYALIKSYAQHLGIPLRWAADAYAWITRREEQRLWRRMHAVAFLSDADMAAARATGVRGNFILAPEGVPLPPLRDAVWPGRNAPLLFLFSPRVPQNVANLRAFIERYWVRIQAAGLLPGTALAVTGASSEELARLLRVTVAELQALNVRALGFVESLREVFASALALVSPTFVGAGVRKKILEAMAHQVPVIATALDLRSCDFYQRDVNILSMDSVEDLVQAVRRLADDPAFWRSLSRAGRSTVERHANWDRFADVVLAEIARLLDTWPARRPGSAGLKSAEAMVR